MAVKTEPGWKLRAGMDRGAGGDPNTHGGRCARATCVREEPGKGDQRVNTG